MIVQAWLVRTFAKLIKMMKHWSAHHGDYLQSYHIEVMALQAITAAQSDAPWDTYQFFRQVHDLTGSMLWHEGAWVDNYLSSTDRAEFRSRLEKAAEVASVAWYKTFGSNSDHEGAIRLWRQVLGDQFPTYG